ncbi:cryptochrome/photolyase family protein [Rhizobium sp. PL01]|uniref:cryptochrome/photolyase family protein n=1 Tax=Rhizobium sp. PL01 TaxID=3085631 RepID=UPI002981E446|nr:cryptochrome/photolyase family protein [Rhizobium sp. PL01]MDW5317079.1 cryptochrome/photolyase family protein [Rhizobium sp. PL01]
MTNLILILGDQLCPQISSLDGADREHDVVLMCEVMSEATYVGHHKKKLAFIFSAMRHFAEELQEAGYQVRYTKITDKDNAGSFTGEVKRAVNDLKLKSVCVTEPGEWRVLEEMKLWSETLRLPVDIRPDRRFLCSHEEFARWADGRKSLTMEFFYRDMRRRTGLLMQGDEPVGGRWNFDTDNRKPAEPDLLRPRHLRFAPDKITTDVLQIVEKLFPENFGMLAGFGFAVTRTDAESVLERFIADFLASFGETQDAMLRDDPFLNHSLLSFYINAGLLDALAVCRAAERAYLDERAPINAVEGFIRQIIGWREYMRGIYWHAGPVYADSNFFENTRPLPAFYWSGKTDMNCLSVVINETIEHAYAHHIQRLMITGNFALLVGIDPKAVHVWYLEVYADAYEWVELPNVVGMSQFADGGFLGTKPYAASGNYINRMSDYCGTCRFDPKKRVGDNACPFNALYWDFLARNRNKLRANRRLAQPYATWDRMDEGTQRAIRRQAAGFLADLK